ncbi:hypothetical protein [Aquitalea aquatica]|jgi:hypothetical protein|uniref:Uncharacterized protein n=1 Tax=Aquitalea aquatica TaxID=3044273 RepID=A0A838Y164_9NEIS|nr:hypothetical protein [Aquitalea magnusonii]MBA4707002.1 hypothetical protein [Aquitalea magnusonii]
MDGISQVSGQNVSSATEIFALKKSLQASGQSVLSLVQGASDTGTQITQAASNPAHLGQSVDVRA